MPRTIQSDGRPVDLDVDLTDCLVQHQHRTHENGPWIAYTEYLWLHTRQRRAIVRLTPRVRDAVRAAGIQDGLVLVSAMHITAAVYVNDHETGIMEDMMRLLDGLAPYRPDYMHHRTGEDNADAHLKSLLLHHEVVVPVTQGDLDLGPWQEIFYAEFDGQRRKRVLIKAVGVR